MNQFEINLGHLLNKAARLNKWELNKRLVELDLTLPQFIVLKDINFQEQRARDVENLTAASIAQRLHIERPTISGVIARLMKKDLVYRVENPEDRRSQLIRLTEKAKALMVELEVICSDTTNRAVKDFSEAEINNLKAYLLRIISNLS
ncbi:MarR family transcriptional regulator [Petroclostridium sp. X23]|uniref:MarR family winged helix-turn-helix transcriptional regulator n=1 Tax=Petroclostridium sp. X23 TaxID=3045146 RepID=UPI0024ACC73F|nr:MarR family transcriptional regulator [Petroclostridium sp. X23]WHH56983.1 MarR family transcriptional regulator [Petroclostridium sp. X23]